jgi:hypothetical protein
MFQYFGVHMRKLMMSLAMALAAAHASANVIYQWQPVADKTPQHLQLEMVFSDAAIIQDSVSIHSSDQSTFEAAGLLSFYYNFAEDRLPIAFAPSSATNGLPGGLDMELRFLPGGRLAGGITAYNIENSFSMTGESGLFTVTTANSDAGMEEAGCAWGSDCAGAMGRFVRVDEELPEPGIWAIFAAGCLSLLSVRRHSRK